MPPATGKPSCLYSVLIMVPFSAQLSSRADVLSFFPFVLLWIILVMQVERWKTSTATLKHPFPISCAVHPGGYALWRCSQKQISVFQTHELYSDGNCFTCGCGVISVFTGSNLWFYCSLNRFSPIIQEKNGLLWITYCFSDNNRVVW